MKRHPNCKILIHRPHPPLGNGLKMGHKFYIHTYTCCPVERTPEVDGDPFDLEADPKNCHALESCLWELQVVNIIDIAKVLYITAV